MLVKNVVETTHGWKTENSTKKEEEEDTRICVQTYII